MTLKTKILVIFFSVYEEFLSCYIYLHLFALRIELLQNWQWLHFADTCPRAACPSWSIARPLAAHSAAWNSAARCWPGRSCWAERCRPRCLAALFDRCSPFLGRCAARGCQELAVRSVEWTSCLLGVTCMLIQSSLYLQLLS